MDLLIFRRYISVAARWSNRQTDKVQAIVSSFVKWMGCNRVQTLSTNYLNTKIQLKVILNLKLAAINRVLPKKSFLNIFKPIKHPIRSRNILSHLSKCRWISNFLLFLLFIHSNNKRTMAKTPIIAM